jgi:TubC N-terminal docking domain
MTGSAASLIRNAEAFGIILEVRGDNLRCGSRATMPPALRDLLREHKPDIIKELERRASRAESGLAVPVGSVLPPSKTPPAPARPMAP